jgi:hypothetical protein
MGNAHTPAPEAVANRPVPGNAHLPAPELERRWSAVDEGGVNEPTTREIDMSPTELILILTMTGYAVYQQTRRHELHQKTRFKLAIIYGLVGLAVGGFNLPHTPLSITFLGISIALSVVVGLIRGRYTRIWREGSTLFSQGTTLTVTLFLLLIASKIALGTIAYFLHASDDGGFGEIMIMIALMVAVQAELIWRRAKRLPEPTDSSAPVPFTTTV